MSSLLTPLPQNPVNLDSFCIVKYSPRIDNRVVYIVGVVNGDIISQYQSLIPVQFYKPLYGAHITLMNGNIEHSGRPLYYGENAILRFQFQQSQPINHDGRRFYIKVEDFHGDLGNFRESLGLTRKRIGLEWHISIGYEK